MDERRRLPPEAFAAPPEYAGRFGAYRSLLVFDEGRPVRSAREWPARRKEILARWRQRIGPWPQVLRRPAWEILSDEPWERGRRQRVRLEILSRRFEEGWLLLPEGKGPFPAALVVFYEPETIVGLNPQHPLVDFGAQLSRRGFVTLSIGAPGGARKPDFGGLPGQPLLLYACVAAHAWQALANLPFVDPARIGVLGHSFGGKWALFAAAFWEKFAAVAVSDPGIVFDETRPNVNYWEPWYLGLDPERTRTPGVPTSDNPRTGAYRLLVDEGRDLHEIHALLAPRPFFVSGGSEDPPARWLALHRLVEVNRLLGCENRVAMTNRPDHTPTLESNAALCAFFMQFLGKETSG